MLSRFIKVFPHEYKRVLGVSRRRQPYIPSPALAVLAPRPSRCTMGKDTGFLEYSRELATRRPVAERVNDWFEIYHDFPEEKLRNQGARCMDCGVPFCHTGCPVNNLIPDWNDLVYRGRWKEAVRQLHATNNFPEFTGRICPAPCEASCVLGINEPPVTIKQIEKNIVERGFRGRLDPPRAAQSPHRQKSRDRRFRARGTGRRSAIVPRRTLRYGLRKSRPHRRLAALRHPRIQNGEARHRSPPGTDVRRRREICDRRGGRARMSRSRICGASSTRFCWPAAPSSRAI